MGLLKGKKALILGVANDKSIAWGIAKAFSDEGAELAFTFAGEVLEKRVRPLAESVNAKLVMQCDVTKDEEVSAVMKEIEKTWGKFDIVVHSVAYAKKDDLKGGFISTTRDGFALAMDISAYSLVHVTREAFPYLNDGATVLTLSYLGAERAVPNYNMMGVAKAALEACVRYLAVDLGPHNMRINAISAGPIRTLAASGIGGFWDLIAHVEKFAPMKRSVTIEEVGRNAVYLCSELSSGTTGEVIHVDGGHHAVI